MPVGKSDRLPAGAWLRCSCPSRARRTVENTPEVIEGMTILYADDDIVAVDKPPGVAAHASVGWHGPTVLGGLAAAGYRICTSGIARTAGHRAAPGCRHVRRDGGGAVRARLHRAQAGVQAAHRRQAVPRPGAGSSRTRPAAPSTRRSGGTAATTGSSRSPTRRAAQRHPLRHRRGVPGAPACSTSTWRPAAPTRSGCTSPRCTIRAAATSPTAPTRRWREGSGCSGSGCTPGRWRFAHPADGRLASRSPAPYPDDLQHALDVLRRHA